MLLLHVPHGSGTATDFQLSRSKEFNWSSLSVATEDVLDTGVEKPLGVCNNGI